MWTPEAFGYMLLYLNPASWPGRREEAHQVLVEWFAAADGRTVPLLLPAWVSEGLGRKY
jgi:hypothetical protein